MNLKSLLPLIILCAATWFGWAAEPVLRDRAEVEAILAKSKPANPPAALKTLNVLLVSGVKDHGPNEHDYPRWLEKWKELFGKAASVHLTTSFGWPRAEDWQGVDVVVFYCRNTWAAEQLKDLDAYLEKGGGVVAIHTALCPPAKNADELATRLGYAWKDGKTKFRHGALDLKFTAPADNPIVGGLGDIHFVDETYWNFTGQPKGIEVLATAEEDKAPQPIIWTYPSGKGKVFVSVLGHFIWTFDDPYFRLITLRGIAWAAGEDARRFDGLVTDGVIWK